MDVIEKHGETGVPSVSVRTRGRAAKDSSDTEPTSAPPQRNPDRSTRHPSADSASTSTSRERKSQMDYIPEDSAVNAVSPDAASAPRDGNSNRGTSGSGRRGYGDHYPRRCYYCNGEGHLQDDCEDRKKGLPSATNEAALASLEIIAKMPEWETCEHSLKLVRCSLPALREIESVRDRVIRVREIFQDYA